jgi:competence/damage-inducible protein CinA C-terminal domain
MKNLNKKVVSILKKKKVKLAIAESCTGGMLSSAITSVSGSSKVFTMGLVTYSNKSKNLLLKIPNIIIKNYGAVSSQCCSYMVNNLSKISKTNLAVSITGVAGPGGGTNLKPVGLVYIGIKNKDKIKIYRYLFKKKKRSQIQKSTVKKALQLILDIFK